VLALFVAGQALVNGVVVDGEMPGEVADTIVSGGQRTARLGFGVHVGVCCRRTVPCGVNSDVGGSERDRPFPSILATGDEVLGDGGAQFPCPCVYGSLCRVDCGAG